MEGPVYSEVLAKHGISLSIPDKPKRAGINRLIFDELVNAVFTENTRDYFVRVIRNFKKEGCDAVVLGCTEIPLIIDDSISPLPTLDSTRLLAMAALNEAVS